MSAETRDVTLTGTDRLFWTLAAVALVAVGVWKMVFPPHDNSILFLILGIVCWRERSR